MSDPFSNHESGLTSPARNAAAVTPNDGADLAVAARALYIGAGSGGLKVTMQGGQDVTFAGLSVGVLYPFSVTRVWATGTTASSIVAIW
jgi:hypothetical protein